jgi:hypothetical protein
MTETPRSLVAIAKGGSVAGERLLIVIYCFYFVFSFELHAGIEFDIYTIC